VVQPKPKDEVEQESSEETAAESVPFVSLAASPPPPPPDAPSDSNAITPPEAVQLKPLTLDAGTIMPKEDMNFGAGPPASPITMSSPAASFDVSDAPHFAPQLDLPQPHLPSSALNISIVQRDDDSEGGGLLSGVRSRINGIVDGLRSGWNSLAGMAEGAFESVRGQVSSVTDELGGLVSSAVSQVQSGWENVKETVTTITQGIQEQLNGPIDAIVGAAQSIAGAVMRLDASAIRSAWARVMGLMSGLWQQVQQVGQSVFQRVRGLWDGLQNTFSGLMNNIASRASAVFDRVRSIAEGLGQRLASAWEGLQSRAAQLSGVLGGVLDRLRSLVSSLLAWGQQIWSGIQQQWNGLRSRVSSLMAQVQQQVTSIWDGLRERANGVWNQVQGLWAGLQGWVQQQVGRVTSGVLSIWQRFQNFTLDGLIEKIEKYAPLIQEVEKVVADPEGVLKPVFDQAASTLESGMPTKALELGQQHLEAQAGAAGSGAASQPAASGVIQRTPDKPERSTVSFGDVLSGLWSAIKQKWAGLSVKDMISHVWEDFKHPFSASWRELTGLWNDLKKVFSGFFGIRSVSADPLGALHDLYSNFLHITDITIVIFHRANNLIGIWLPWVALLTIAGTTALGALIGSIFGPEGTAVGAIAGLGAGYGLSEAIGLGAAALYVTTETYTLYATLVQLLTGEQTETEQLEDYSQAADSLIGLAMILLLAGIAFLAKQLVSVAAKLLKGIKIRIQMRGKLKGGEPPGTDPNTPRPVDPSVPKEKKPVRLMTNEELAEAATKLTIGDVEHTMKPMRIGQKIILALCTTCGSLIEKIDSVLSQISPGGDTKSLHARLTKLRQKAVDLEVKIENGSVEFTDIPKEANQIGAHLNDLSQRFPAFENQLNTGKLTVPSPDDFARLAARLGYDPTPYRSHGQAVYSNGRTFISPDVDMHNGGVWKMADSPRNLARKETRMGTYDAKLDRIGD
jgi:phage-related protein